MVFNPARLFAFGNTIQFARLSPLLYPNAGLPSPAPLQLSDLEKDAPPDSGGASPVPDSFRRRM